MGLLGGLSSPFALTTFGLHELAASGTRDFHFGTLGGGLGAFGAGAIFGSMLGLHRIRVTAIGSHHRSIAPATTIQTNRHTVRCAHAHRHAGFELGDLYRCIGICRRFFRRFRRFRDFFYSHLGGRFLGSGWLLAAATCKHCPQQQ